MCSSITVNNSSGAAQTVAVLVADPGQNGAVPLVWKSINIPNGANKAFDCDNGEFGFGWGTTNAVIAPGVLFTSRQVEPVGPVGAADANNYALLTYDKGSFSVGEPYLDRTLPDGQLVLASNQSFTVSTAEKDHSCIALFLQKLPVMVQQLAPSTSYYFDPMNVMFYLTVTRAKPGIAVPPPRQNLERIDRILAISMSTPTLVTFSPGTPNVIFDLTPTLMFQPAA